MKGFFDNVSWDMERSALIDGASRYRVWWQIILPQVKPGLAALSVFTFIIGWSAYLIPATFTIGTSLSQPAGLSEPTAERHGANQLEHGGGIGSVSTHSNVGVFHIHTGTIA